MTDINLRILLNASQGNTMSVISGIQRALGGSGGLQGALTAVGIAAAGMAVAIGVEAVNKASAFQNAMLQNVAHAGLAKDQFDAVSQSVLNMSTDVGQMPTDLAKGLYPILSGFSGISNESAKAQSSLEALRLAAEDVVGTETKTTVTSGALVSAFNALGLQTNDTATNISRLKTLNDQMEATVIAGNMHWDTYANVIGKLATAIKGTNVQWTEASAALATMTNEGFTAQRSQTYLANLFTQLDLKTDSLVKNAKKLNITFDEQKFKSMGLMDQLNYLKNITGDNSSEVLKLLNNNATALKTYNALESGMKTYKSALDSIKNSQGATAQAFATASSGFDAAKQRMKAAIDVLLIDLGTQLLPVLSKVLDWVTPLIKRFADWVVNSRDLHTWLNNVGAFLQYMFLPAVVNTASAIANFVGWLAQGSAPALLLRGVLESIAAVTLAVKVGNMAQSIANMGAKAIDFVTGAGPKLLDLLSGSNGIAQAADKAGTSAATASLKVKALGDESAVAGPKMSTLATDSEAAATGEAASGEAALAAEPKIAGLGGVVGGILGSLGILLVSLQTAVQIANSLGVTSGPTSNIDATSKNIVGITKALHPERWPTPSFPTSPIHHGPRFASGVTNFSGGLAYVHGGEVLANLAPHTNVIPANRVGGMGGTTVVIQNLNINNPMRTRNDLAQMVDDIERELGARFRGQTAYGFGGIV